MAVFVPAGQPTQLVGLPPFEDETYDSMDDLVRELYDKYAGHKKSSSSKG